MRRGSSVGRRRLGMDLKPSEVKVVERNICVFEDFIVGRELYMLS